MGRYYLKILFEVDTKDIAADNKDTAILLMNN